MQGVLKLGVPDEATLAVARNNLVALAAAEAGETSGKKLFSDLLKRMEPLIERVRPLPLCLDAASKQNWLQDLQQSHKHEDSKVHGLVGSSYRLADKIGASCHSLL